MRTSADYATAVVASAQLSFLEIQQRLMAAPRPSELATFRTRLACDYQRVNELLRESPEGNRYFSTAELRLLRMQYRIARSRDNISITLRGVPSRTALGEMSEIVGFLANAAGAARRATAS